AGAEVNQRRLLALPAEAADPLDKFKCELTVGAFRRPYYHRNEHRQAFEPFWLLTAYLEYLLVRNDLNEAVAQGVRRHPERAHFIFRPEVPLDRRVDRAWMDQGPAGGLDEDDLLGVLGIGLVVAGTQLS